MLTRKKKEALATSQLNMYLEEELNKYTLYTEPMGQLMQQNLQNLLGLRGWEGMDQSLDGWYQQE